MKYGPQTPEIEALLARLGEVTEDEAVAMDDACYAALGAARYAARYDALDDVQSAARYDARYDALNAALNAARHAARYDARHAIAARYTIAALAALAVRDLISDDGFTQAQYDLLTGPWRTVIGPIHPDDKENTQMTNVTYLFVLQGHYGTGWEDIYASYDYEEVLMNRRAYIANEGGRYRVVRRKEEALDDA